MRPGRDLWGGKPLDAITVTSRPAVPVGMQALIRNREIIYFGAIGDPIEDAEFDEILLNPVDFACLKAAVQK
jgi:hypothetical protein